MSSGRWDSAKAGLAGLGDAVHSGSGMQPGGFVVMVGSVFALLLVGAVLLDWSNK